jgi:hypothetical protein
VTIDKKRFNWYSNVSTKSGLLEEFVENGQYFAQLVKNGEILGGWCVGFVNIKLKKQQAS